MIRNLKTSLAAAALALLAALPASAYRVEFFAMNGKQRAAFRKFRTNRRA